MWVPIKFSTIPKSEIPDEWRQEPTVAQLREISQERFGGCSIERHVCIATPDYPVFWAYQQWLQQLPKDKVKDAVPICIQARGIFLEAYGKDGVKQALGTILDSGRPALLWSALFAKTSASGA